MLPINNPPFWLQKKTHRKTGYPLATVACYGPDDQFASKTVIGIMLSEKDEDPAFMKKWFSEGTDVRLDPKIASEMVAFIEEHDVRRVVMMERIIGCPHEEGIDYPEGEWCPECPFWKNRDRWTGEMLE